MQISLKAPSTLSRQKSACLVLPLTADDLKALPGDAALNSAIERVTQRGDFAAKLAQTLMLPWCDGVSAERILLVGLGEADSVDAKSYDKTASALFNALKAHKLSDAAVVINSRVLGSEAQISALARLAETSAYQYTTSLSKKADPGLKKLNLLTANNASAKKALAQGQAVGKGINVARQLGNLPGNYCTPSFLAKEAKALGRKSDKLKVSVLEEKKMRELGMGSLLSVTAGSEEPAKLIVMEYQGGKKSDKPQVLVGKGITFDSGGISIKPGAKMDEMKFDMCGAASVMGAMTAVTELGLPINVVGIIAAAENLPSGRATKPGDVVTSMSGQTIEVLNTDAEGRLVLCDALTYSERFKPAAVIDIATLTGACVVALGKHASGLYSNDDAFAEKLLDAGERSGDRAWHMPLWDEYQGQLDSNFADIANIGGPEAGSVTAACFLSRFTKNMTWAHLDIAGTAWLSAPKGATGRPVGLLMQYLLDCAS
ncbi:leucyl aminopeptidase [Litorivivens lipolytica]|uniref:Probable cytosol aminopeptidase n=1 Tax=Litorivivens lipolytica TaxID=1524264 RepID=A0A7W4W3Q8_9GAMM|nr:leucyl aminopeptidase [Litorivivens lipolytica]MBB3046881.1 leucyl aminopeptidase [Litorivivens lipolytica]